MDERKLYVEMPTFTGANVPINEVAKIMHKDPMFIRLGLQNGKLPIGTAFKKSDDGVQFDYYVSPRLLFEFTGYVWHGGSDDEQQL